jgi:diaminohydroxyphosphoribosylaminopyrimidine deaminase/5-amino-6-(5-phosphoribosylamino)uracil reductase
VLQLMIEGGASVAADVHRAGLVDRYVLYLAPALFGGDDTRGLFAGPAAATIDEVWRGRLQDVRRVGTDLRVDMVPHGPPEGIGGIVADEDRGSAPGEGAG